MAVDPNYMRIPSLGTSVYTFFNKDGKPDHIGVDVGMKYTFHFRNGRLIKIEDFTTGSWDVFSKKDEIEWWMNLRGSRTATTHPVGEKVPNLWGLYDMLGNVWEMVLDWYGVTPVYDESGVTTDFGGASSGAQFQRYICGACYTQAVPLITTQAGQICSQSFAITGWRLWAPCEAK